MSENNSPIQTLFQLQRDTIKQTEEVLEQALRVPRDVGDTLYSGVGTQQEVQAQALDLARKSVHTSLDAA